MQRSAEDGSTGGGRAAHACREQGDTRSGGSMPIPGDKVLWGSRALLQGAGLTPETSNAAALLRTAREVRFFWYKKYYMPQIKIQKMPREIRTALQKNTHHVF